MALEELKLRDRPVRGMVRTVRMRHDCTRTSKVTKLQTLECNYTPLMIVKGVCLFAKESQADREVGLVDQHQFTLRKLGYGRLSARTDIGWTNQLACFWSLLVTIVETGLTSLRMETTSEEGRLYISFTE